MTLPYPVIPNPHREKAIVMLPDYEPTGLTIRYTLAIGATADDCLVLRRPRGQQRGHPGKVVEPEGLLEVQSV